MTDEELEKIKLPRCPSCGSHLTSVRRVAHDTFYVGCVDCFCKRECDEGHLQETIEFWTRYAVRVNARRWGDE